MSTYGKMIFFASLDPDQSILEQDEPDDALFDFEPPASSED